MLIDTNKLLETSKDDFARNLSNNIMSWECYWKDELCDSWRISIDDPITCINMLQNQLNYLPQKYVVQKNRPMTSERCWRRRSTYFPQKDDIPRHKGRQRIFSLYYFARVHFYDEIGGN